MPNGLHIAFYRKLQEPVFEPSPAVIGITSLAHTCRTFVPTAGVLHINPSPHTSSQVGSPLPPVKIVKLHQVRTKAPSCKDAVAPRSEPAG